MNNFSNDQELLKQFLSVFKPSKAESRSKKGANSLSSSASASKGKTNSLNLKPEEEVAQILSSVADIESFQSLMKETLVNWVSAALSEPRLVAIKYGEHYVPARANEQSVTIAQASLRESPDSSGQRPSKKRAVEKSYSSDDSESIDNEPSQGLLTQPMPLSTRKTCKNVAKMRSKDVSEVER